MTHIEPAAFCEFFSLRDLMIVQNKLTEPPTLEPVKRTINSLTLDNNLINHVPDNYFLGFHDLEHVALIDNKLKEVPNVCGLSRILLNLALSKNRITTVNGAWTSCHYYRLESIDLSKNLIREGPEDSR